MWKPRFNNYGIVISSGDVGNVQRGHEGANQRAPQPQPQPQQQVRLLLAYGHLAGTGGVVRLDREGEAIDEAFRGEQGARFSIERRFAVTAEELRNVLMEHRPQLLHIGAHADHVGICLESSPEPGGRLLTYSALAGFVTALAERPRVVVLNACNSANEAHRLLEAGVVYVVAMDCQLADRDSELFARAFYGAVVRGAAVGCALASAKELMRDNGSRAAADCVQEHAATGIDPNTLVL